MTTAQTRDTGLRRFKPYTRYRDSGIEWLGEIPAHWEVKPLKHLTTFATGWTPPTGQEDLYGGDHLWANIGDLGPKVLYTTEKTISDAAMREARMPIAAAGSLLFSFKLSVGTVSLAGVDMYTNEAIAAFAPSERIDTGYLYWAAPLLVPHNAQDNIYGAPLLNRERMATATLLSPTISEQRAIAAFLDGETAKIDALVAEKRRLIERLREKRTAVITRAVTKGLDPDVPIKDSGIEWLGDIPAHWEVKQLRWAIMFQRGHDLPADEREDGEVPVVSSSGISSTHSRAVAKAPGIVTGRYGTIGDFHLVTQDYWPLNTTLYSIDLRGNEPRFLRFMLTNLSPLFLLNAVKSAVPGVDRNDIHPIRTAIPPVREQREIADFVDQEVARIDALVANIRAAIVRLNELRTALISAAVTGKIDVQGEAP